LAWNSYLKFLLFACNGDEMMERTISINAVWWILKEHSRSKIQLETRSNPDQW
jgi:hypothetical protein